MKPEIKETIKYIMTEIKMMVLYSIMIHTILLLTLYIYVSLYIK